MKATGSSTERTIWNYFCCKGFSPAGVAGLMGNLYAESGLNPTNLQNTYEKRLGLTDAEYTAAVDSGSYSNFVRDSAGYGLAQWTYWSRKEAMLNYARKTGASIGDLMMQLDFMFQELKGHVARLPGTPDSPDREGGVRHRADQVRAPGRHEQRRQGKAGRASARHTTTPTQTLQQPQRRRRSP